jgi:TonB family protein
MPQQSVRILLPCLSLALLPCFLAPSQEPTDPKALMLAAAKLNNLATSDAKPWHIKASFQLFDDQGVVTDEGTYEESWASPVQFKRTFTGKNFSQTAYGSKVGLMLAGAKGNTPEILLAARNNLVHPMPEDVIIEHTTYTTKPLDAGSVKLLCVIPSAPAPGAPADNSAYCLNTDEPMLRIAARPSTSDQTFHNRVLRVEDRTIAGDLKITHNGKPALTLHVESAELLDPSEEASFTPPPDAVAAPTLVTIPGTLAAAMVISREPPVYPPAAITARISGTVALLGVISKEGTIEDLKVINGPSIFQQAAIDAVHKWRYRPYLLNGKPVAVQTTIYVVFSLGG